MYKTISLSINTLPPGSLVRERADLPTATIIHNYSHLINAQLGLGGARAVRIKILISISAKSLVGSAMTLQAYLSRGYLAAAMSSFA